MAVITGKGIAKIFAVVLFAGAFAFFVYVPILANKEIIDFDGNNFFKGKMWAKFLEDTGSEFGWAPYAIHFVLAIVSLSLIFVSAKLGELCRDSDRAYIPANAP